MTDTAVEKTDTATADYDYYQWAWEFARRGEGYNLFYPSCVKARDKSLQALDPERRKRIEALGGGPDFKNSAYHDRLHNEFGLNFPVHPDTPADDFVIFAWDFSACLQGILLDVKNPDPRYHIKLFADLRLPREYQVEAYDRFLREKGCAEAVKKRQPGKFAEFLDCYDIRKRLREELDRDPTNFEIACRLWPDLAGGEITDKELADRVRYPLKMAEHYIDNKGYFEILRWRPPAKK